MEKVNKEKALDRFVSVAERTTELRRLNQKEMEEIKKKHNENINNSKSDQLFLISEKVIPDILKLVLKAKKLVETKHISIQEAVKKTGISRASYYKYADYVFPFNKETKGKIVSLALSAKDRLGLLSEITGIISKYKSNIITIHQSVPVNKQTNISFSIEVANEGENISRLLEEIEHVKDVDYCKVLAMEER